MGGRGQEVRAQGQGEGEEEESVQRKGTHQGWPCTVVQVVHCTTPVSAHARTHTPTHTAGKELNSKLYLSRGDIFF